mgnify:CR=1 FL=1|jgi:hypothetical protein
MEILYVTPPTGQLVHYEVAYRKPMAGGVP